MVKSLFPVALMRKYKRIQKLISKKLNSKNPKARRYLKR
jgi:hypothetical protein